MLLETQHRRSVAAGRLKDEKADALLVTFSANVRYLCGFTGSSGALLLWSGGARFFTDPRYTIQASREVDCPAETVKGPLLKAVADRIRRLKFKRIAFEGARIGFDDYQFLKDHLALGAALKPAAGWIERQRMVKSDGEIERIRKSVRTNSAAYERVLKKVRPGIRESELAAELDFQMRRLGADGCAFETIVACGERTALPHARPTAAKLENDQLLLIDMGASQDGYASDMTRVSHFGRPKQKIREMYRAVLEAQLAAISRVRAGRYASEVDAAARKVLKSYQLDREFIHSTGHGLGLEIHEPPRLGKKEKARLEAGMVITIEPGVYVEGRGGIRIEDTVLVTETGCEILTPTPKELVSL
ncbi:MAG: Xaa-Pro peptidase family protein [Bryobacteraceae bacterium]|nr:Xaa-Pro peptidase family protein [Bryobacteraceae bacterium]